MVAPLNDPRIFWSFPTLSIAGRICVLTIIALASLVIASRAAEVTVQWDGPSSEEDVKGYMLYVFDELASLEPIDVGLTTTRTITGLDPNHRYVMFVTAYN